jgi:protoporphyrinogen oxidase
MILPTLPLAEIFDRRVGDYLSDRSVKIHRRTKVMWIESDENSQLSLVLPEGDAIAFDAIILAAPWHQAGNLFPPELLAELPEISRAQKLPSGTITAVHLWFDRPIMALPHAVLVDKLSQWIFQGVAKKSSEGQDAESTPAYYQVVISAAHRLAKLDKEALLSQVLEDISAAFPDAKNASLLHSRVVVQPNAVFSLQPGVEKHRPSPSTSLANLFLAGDWTATGWPATMEGAVRSGYAAVENLLKSFERSENLVVPDLPRGFFSRRILGG